MKTLLQAVKHAEQEERERVTQEALADEEHYQRVEARVKALKRLLAGFDYEVEPEDDYRSDRIHVALRHPKCKCVWLAFTVEIFTSDDEPFFPREAREIRIRAGQVSERPVPLLLAASEYIIEEEQR